ncbi:hypothetical protein DPMN_068778 [Dreissena polymorpha]|uniref:Uncharacterized protein n=1 Tax=Dreissena polymorpha TaxID=45954 RepID=A0A9D3Z1T1_DREPO|nr:hypothetical protein DPMN_068778 [Dreissena polymorpha]
MRRIADCISDENGESVLEKFKQFINQHDLEEVIVTSMMLTVIISTWEDGIDERMNGPSLCSLYTILIESLCKRANNTKESFHGKLHRNCFEDTEYLQPNIEAIDLLGNAAFSLLFSSVREMSIVFTENEIRRYLNPKYRSV